jgi:hypothetical protein
MKRTSAPSTRRIVFVTKFGLLTALIVLFSGMAESVEGQGGRTNFRATLGARNDVVAISTVAVGSFRAKIVNENTPQAAIEWELSYSGLEGDATVARLHFGKPGTRGGVIAFLCDNRLGPVPGSSLSGAQPCPATEGTITGIVVMADSTPGDNVTGVGKVETVTFKPTPQHVSGADNTQKVPQGIEAGEIEKVFAALRDQATYVAISTTKFANPGELRGDVR